MRTVIAILSTAVLALGAVGGYLIATHHDTPAPTTATRNPVLHLSQAAHIRSDAGGRSTVTPTGPAYPPSGVLVFTVAVDCSKGLCGFSSADMHVITADGQHVEAGTGRAPAEMGGVPVVFGQITAGEHRRGPVAFDTGALHGVLVYGPPDGPAVRWRF